MNDVTAEHLWEILVVRSIATIGRKSAFVLYQALQKSQIKPEDIVAANRCLCTKKLLSQRQIDAIKKKYSEQENSLEKALRLWPRLRVIWFHSQEYPALLRHSDDPPAFLYALGPVIDWTETTVIGVVGTRNMTEYGKFATEKIAGELGRLGVIVVSGLMYGVDTTAHLAALETGGQSVAILGYGFDHCYPEEHRPAVEKFLAMGGSMYTEYPPWQPAVAGQFPARNTIVAGMCHGVVVTEAAEQSGTMITVQSALDNGRHIFAVPGPINNPYTSGTRYLLNQGATLVASGEEVIGVLPLDK